MSSWSSRGRSRMFQYRRTNLVIRIPPQNLERCDIPNAPNALPTCDPDRKQLSLLCFSEFDEPLLSIPNHRQNINKMRIGSLDVCPSPALKAMEVRNYFTQQIFTGCVAPTPRTIPINIVNAPAERHCRNVWLLACARNSRRPAPVLFHAGPFSRWHVERAAG